MQPSRSAKILVVGIGSVLLGGAALGWLLRSPLPHYELLLEGGRATFLGPHPLLVLDADSRLSITLRPEWAAQRAVFVRAVVEEQSRHIVWPVVFESTEHGTQRLQGTVRELRLPCRSRCTLMLYVSDFVLFPSFLWLTPDAASLRYLPRAQLLQTDFLIAPATTGLPDL